MLIIYNTRTKQKEVFKPINPKTVSLYTCGPTVYHYAHIGNLRTFIFEDVLRRLLHHGGYAINHVMNITDVGHLTSDADEGEDKMEKGARREGKTAWEIADFYTKAFIRDASDLNLLVPKTLAKATDHITDQISWIKKLEDKGYTYTISDGVYFDTSKFKKYGKLTGQPLQGLKEGARVEKNPEKRHPTDFALWKFSPKDSKRNMEWESPWAFRMLGHGADILG
jgi:cysteinyl-tRNA synthetase